MNAALTKLNNSLMMWEDNQKLEEIRKLFAPKLSQMEFNFFVGLGKATGLNPFTREIWCVKYQENVPAQVFIGRDGYRKAAQSHADYDFHQCDAVYENDEFEVTNGEVNHKYKLTNRGELVGAYCIVKRHRSSKPMYVFSELKEYSTGKSLWNGKPATMIKKVAESQCLRACFQDLLGGTYAEEEMDNQNKVRNITDISGSNMTKTQQLKSVLGIGENENEIQRSDNNGTHSDSDQSNILEYNSISRLSTDARNESNHDAGHTIGRSNPELKAETINQKTSKIKQLFLEKNFSEDRIKKALNYYKVDKIEDLDDETTNKLLAQLEKA